MRKNMEKFASQAEPGLLAAIRKIAADEGKPLQTILDEAMRDLVEKKRSDKPRKHVMEALNASINKFDDLYRNLAK